LYNANAYLVAALLYRQKLKRFGLTSYQNRGAHNTGGTKMKKKLIGALVTICLLLSMLPATAFAYPAQTLTLGSITLSAATPYWTNGATAPTATSDSWNAYFDAPTSTLTLKDAVIDNGRDDCSIHPSSGDLNIVLGGTNNVLHGTITLSSGSLTISGGKMTMETRGQQQDGITLDMGKCTINNASLNISVFSPVISGYYSSGINVIQGAVNISGSTVNIHSHSNCIYAYNNGNGYNNNTPYPDGDVVVTDSTLILASDFQNGVFADNGLFSFKGSNITVTNSRNGIGSAFSRNTPCQIENCTMNITADECGFKMEYSDLNVISSNIKASSAANVDYEKSGKPFSGMHVKNLTVSDTAGLKGNSRHLIDLSCTKPKESIYENTKCFSYGLNCESLTLNGGLLKASGTDMGIHFILWSSKDTNPVLTDKDYVEESGAVLSGVLTMTFTYGYPGSHSYVTDYYKCMINPGDKAALAVSLVPKAYLSESPVKTASGASSASSKSASDTSNPATGGSMAAALIVCAASLAGVSLVLVKRRSAGQK
jgi:hypothetical protein